MDSGSDTLLYCYADVGVQCFGNGLTTNDVHRFAWTESWPGYSLIAAIADNSYEHYHDHAQQIQSLLDASKMP